MKGSYWLDQRDIPDGRYGKIPTPGCECTHSFTCGACLDRAAVRNRAEGFVGDKVRQNIPQPAEVEGFKKDLQA